MPSPRVIFSTKETANLTKLISPRVDTFNPGETNNYSLRGANLQILIRINLLECTTHASYQTHSCFFIIKMEKKTKIKPKDLVLKKLTCSSGLAATSMPEVTLAQPELACQDVSAGPGWDYRRQPSRELRGSWPTPRKEEQ
jgi:hypothetical protein